MDCPQTYGWLATLMANKINVVRNGVSENSQ